VITTSVVDKSDKKNTKLADMSGGVHAYPLYRLFYICKVWKHILFTKCVCRYIFYINVRCACAVSIVCILSSVFLNNLIQHVVGLFFNASIKNFSPQNAHLSICYEFIISHMLWRTAGGGWFYVVLDNTITLITAIPIVSIRPFTKVASAN